MDAAVSSRSFDLLNMSGLKISVSNMRENMLFSGEIYTVGKTFILLGQSRPTAGKASIESLGGDPTDL